MAREIITSPRHDRDNGLGYLAVDWIMHFCVHGPGGVQGQPLDRGQYILDNEFQGIIADAYACDDNGTRLYTSAFVSRAKGRAKSELAGFIALFEAFGPCRVLRDEFGVPQRARGGEQFVEGEFVYTYEPGELMGRKIVYPFIRCLATEEGQAGNTYDNIYQNLGGYGYELGSARLIDTFRLSRADVGLQKIKLADGGEIVPSTASSASKDGGKETFVVFDETHLYITPDLHRMYRVVVQNLDKRTDAEAWALETSTMYGPGEDSIAEQTHTMARSILEGKAKIDNTFFDHRQAPHDTNVGDRDSIIAGLREAYGDAAAWMPLERICDGFFDKRRPIANQRRYFLNLPTSARDAWLVYTEWEGAKRAGLRLMPGDKITLGFDGSQKRARGITDASALIACRVSDGLLIPLLIAEQPDGPDGDDWIAPQDEFVRLVDDAFETYSVVGFYADPPLWEETITTWEQKYGARLAVKATPRTPIQWWTNRTTLMGRAIDRFEGAVKDQDLCHDGNLALQRHALNARRRPTAGGRDMGIGKEHPKSRHKIDAIVAAILAFQARSDYLSSGVDKTRRPNRAVALKR